MAVCTSKEILNFHGHGNFRENCCTYEKNKTSKKISLKNSNSRGNFHCSASEKRNFHGGGTSWKFQISAEIKIFLAVHWTLNTKKYFTFCRLTREPQVLPFSNSKISCVILYRTSNFMSKVKERSYTNLN
jgi:hypothetical protein